MLFAFSTTVFSQPWLKQLPQVSNAYKEKKQVNFYDIEKAFTDYWSTREVKEEEEENANEGGHQQFMRWAHMMRYRTYPTGEFYDPDILYKEFYKLKQNNHLKSLNATAPWTYIGQNMVPANGGGVGRINVVRIHPTNNQILYVGAACGGVWKTTDGGATWTTSTDLLPSISIADIAINPNYPDSVYIATGDGYGYEVGGDFWGGLYTGGIFVSGDGGNIWNATPMSFVQISKNIFQRLLINPVNTNVLLACSRQYVYHSADAGQTWTRVLNGHFYDMEFQPGNPSIVYACNDSKVYKSTDGGITYTPSTQTLGTGRMSISVTADNPNVVYALSENGNFWKSTDAGVTFTAKTSPAGFTTFYGYYDNVLATSPADENQVLTGGIDPLISFDGGTSWFLAANNGGSDYVHADQKGVEFENNSTQVFYAVNDGGIFKTDDAGLTWIDIGAGIHIKQYYKIASSLSNPAVMYAGAQDNGTDQFTGSTWRKVLGGDGMDCATDPFSTQYAYYSWQYGNFVRTSNNGNTNTNITPSGQSGDWVTPIAVDPVNSQTIYIGYQDLYRSLNRGTNWSSISSNVFGGGDFTILKIAQSNTNYIYAGTLSQIKKSTDGGFTFVSIAAGLPLAQAALSDICISTSNPDYIWVTLSGYSAGKKVYHSSDGGVTWTNVSGTLPNLPATCAIYQPGSNEMVYVGTDVGVFYKDNNMNDWQPYMNGLPNVMIAELEIIPSLNKLRAATYGRGIWEADLATSVFSNDDAGLVSFNTFPQNICASSYVPDVIIKNYGSAALINATISYSIDNGAWNVLAWTGNLNPLATALYSLPSMSLANGPHTLAVAISNPNGVADPHTFNDSVAVSFVVTTTSTIPPVTEDFQTAGAPFNFTITDPNSILNITNQAGGFGLSTSSLIANYYTVSYGTAYMLSQPIDMTVFTGTPRITFDVAYRYVQALSRDTLQVQVSTDCGLTWTSVYAKTTMQLGTVAGFYLPPFVPTASQWRNEVVSLAPYASSANLLIRFIFKTAYGNNLYLDNINLNQTTGFNELSLSNLSLFPNPAHDVLYIQSALDISSAFSVSLTDLSGRLVFTQKYKSLDADKKIGIDISAIAPGFYNASIWLNNGTAINTPVIIWRH